MHELEKVNAKATFFCVGENAQKFPEILQQLINNNHAVANHTMHHLNSRKTIDTAYVQDFLQANVVFKSNLFRPPYGMINKKIAKQILPTHKIIMWNKLSQDYNNSIDTEITLRYLTHKTKCGDIIVFHDSEKSFVQLQQILPKYLKAMKNKGFQMNAIK